MLLTHRVLVVVVAAAKATVMARGPMIDGLEDCKGKGETICR